MCRDRLASLPVERRAQLLERRRIAARVVHEILACIICGKPYLARHKNCQTCSPECRAVKKRKDGVEWWQIHKPFPLESECVICGGRFVTHNPRQRTCRQQCRSIFRARFIAQRNAERAAALNIVRKLINEGPEALL